MNKKSVKELKEIAKELHIKNWWTLKKDELIAAIEEANSMTEEEKETAAEQKAKEEAALEEYRKDWRKYTDRFNPVEFIEKFRAGEIDMDNEDEKNDMIEKKHKKNTAEQNENSENEKSETNEDEEPSERFTPKRGALLEFDGRSMNICAWAKELGVNPNTLYGRIYKMGWTIERAFTTPSKKK